MLYIYNKKEELIDIIKKEDIIKALHKEVLNGENIFSFSVEANNPNLIEGNLVGFKDLDNYWQIFEIKRIVDAHGDGLTRTAYCEHIFYELLDDIVTDKRPSADATSALDGMLQGTRWQIGIVDDLGVSSCNAYYESALSAVQKVANAWQGELRWRIIVSNNQITERRVDLLKMRGTDTGKQFAYSKDILSIEREIDASNIATALYGRGKGVETESGSYGRRLTFADIVAPDKPKGQEWIGDFEALVRWGRNGRHRFDVFIDEDETDPVKLLEKTRQELARRKEPRTTYRLNVVSLEELAGYEHEKVRLGDLVRVIDREFIPELVVSARIVELERDLLVPENTKVVLGNFAPTIVEATINIQRQINEMSSKPYNTKWLDGVIDVLQNAIENTQSYVFQTAEEGILILDAPDYEQATQAMKLGGGIFAIANQKDGNGGWNWRTFGTGSGFTADEITTGKIRADLVEIGPQTTFAPGYDPSQIEGASDPVRVDKRCKALFHFDGSINDISGITPTFTRNSVAYTFDGKKVEAGVPRFEQGKFGQGVLIEEGTTNLIANPLTFSGWSTSETVMDNDGTFHPLNAKFIRVKNTAWGCLSNSIPASNGQTWSVSFIARKGTGNGEPKAAIMIMNPNNSHVSNILPSFSSKDIRNGWVRHEATFTIDYINTGYIRLRFYVTATNGGYHDFALPQVEQKPYTTTFTDSTRSTETLTIPTAGVLNQQEGTVLFWTKFEDAYNKRKDIFETNIPMPGVCRLILGFNILGNDDGFGLLWRPINDAATEIYSLVDGISMNTDNFAMFGFTYKQNKHNGYIVKIIHNGTVVKVIETDNGLLGQIDSIKLGGQTITVSNGIFDELAIFDYAATDEEIQAWHEADTPFYRLDLPDPSLPGYVKIESDGLKVYDSQDQLRVLLGSWLKDAVRKYGLKIIGGEIYSSFISTRNPDDPSPNKAKAEINPNGSIIIYDMKGREGLYLSGLSGQGSVDWYFDGTRYAGAFVNSGSDRDFIIWTLVDGSGIRLSSSGNRASLDVGAGGSYNVELKSQQTYMSGDLWVSGTLYKGSNNYVEPTENYGIRLLNAVEAPEVVLFDRGRAELKEGECTVYLDPMFLETIEPDTELTPWTFKTEVYGEGEEIRVTEWGENYFKVKECNGGKSNRKFGWWFYAIRKNYVGIRLMEYVSEYVREVN